MTAQFPKADLNEIKKFLYAIFEDGHTIEVRCLDCKENRQQGIREGSIRGGFFNNRDLAAAAIASMSGRCMGVYIIPNQITDELLARFPENTLTAWKEGDGTGDGDITARRWLLIDCDFERTAKISSTDAQHQQALDKAAIIKTYLMETLEFPPDSIISADSGNGGHLMVRVNVPLNKEGDELISDSLKALESLFGDGVDDRGQKKGVHIDLKVFNRARIWKAYGSLAAKGNNTPERPHRIAGLLSVPEKITPFSIKLLKKLAELKPEESKSRQPQSITEHRTYGEKLDLAKWLPEHDLPIKKVSEWQGWVKYEPACCPFDNTHTGSSVTFFQNAEGAIKFRCEHNGCSGRKWEDVRALKEPMYDPNKQQYYNPPPSSGNGHHNDDETANTVNLVWMNTVKAEAIEWLWKPYIPLGKLTMLEGDPGVGKSWILLAIATAVSLGRGLPKVDTVPQGIVLMASAEDGKADTIKPRLNDMGADASKIAIIDDPESRFTLDDAGCDMLEKFINQVKPLILILDPMVAFINGDVDISQANQMRHITKKLANIAEKYHIAIIALRHLTKGGSSKPIYRGLGSIDITAAARSVLMAGEDPETGARGIVHIKSNLAQKGNPIGYSLTDKFYWSDGNCDLTVARILAVDNGGMPKDKAKVFLEELLKDGALPEKQIEDEAETQDISRRTLVRVKKELGIHSFSRPVKGQRGAGAWYWELPIDDYEKEPNF